MKNAIAERIADFLKNFPPFSSLSFAELVTIATEINVLHLEKNNILFKVGDQTHPYFYIVKEGAIGLSVTSDADEALIDKCDEGDILGLRPFFAKDNYLMTAKAREESLLYAIPIELFKPYVSQNQAVLSFLLESFASNTRNPYDKENKGKLISENVIYDEQSSEIQFFQPIAYTRKPITATKKEIVKAVAQTMTKNKIGSVIIEENQVPLGIVTDKDLRSKIATGLFPIDITVDQIMSAPVITVPENISIAETQIMMLKHNIGHLCVTVDGTNKSAIRGIISEHDVVVAQANNPGVLLKQIKRASRSKELKVVREKLSDLIQNSLDKNIPMQHLSTIIGELNNAISKRAVELAIEKMDTEPPTRFAWMSIGSQGRKEQLLMTDQDNALVFEDVDDEYYDETKKYFLELAEKVTKMLNKIGFEFCPAEMMASNPMWCKSLSDWNKQFNSWINTPGEKGILMCSIFFDYDLAFGDEKLVDAMTENIFKQLKDNELFFAYLGTDALRNPPPLGFFRQFLVENDGEHKDAFDIKSRALMPLIDAARLLTLSLGIRGIQNTYNRFKKLAEIEPQNAELFDNCADAFSIVSRFRTTEGLLTNSSGRYLNLNELSKTDKVKLKYAFQPIHEVQQVIKNRFQLTYFT
jgi:CBS domain-containing protein